MIAAHNPEPGLSGPQLSGEVQSVVSYRLFTTKDTLGAMNLYSRTVDSASC